MAVIQSIYHLCQIFVFAILVGYAMGASVPCQKLNATQLHSQWAQYLMQQPHESYFAMELYRNTIASDLAAGNDDETRGDEIPEYGDNDNSHCNLTHIQGQDALQQDRSYCPWYNVINRDLDRYPTYIAQARCRCVYGPWMGSATACEEVHYNIRVLRKTSDCDENGYYIFTPGWQSVSVGCTLTKMI